ncbi:hypothetical protein SELMODRAFT_422680 [Selaginella moellendorffii]|uniref:Glutamine amidotransferase type-2 domain-containing protein n=1 Tax=Selaginella moellendorffii TaxID=88036 RepID=D8SJ71_SELML|nr:hypothetical protein SELMODRAFT_422680 [Selaginella moellendorffii]
MRRILCELVVAAWCTAISVPGHSRAACISLFGEILGAFVQSVMDSNVRRGITDYYFVLCLIDVLGRSKHLHKSKELVATMLPGLARSFCSRKPIERGTIGIAMKCEDPSGFVVFFDSLTTTECEDEEVWRESRGFKIVEICENPRLMLGAAGNVKERDIMAKLLKIKAKEEEFGLEEAAEFLKCQADVAQSVITGYLASFFIYNDSELFMVRDLGAGFQVYKLSSENPILAIGSGSVPARRILENPVEGQRGTTLEEVIDLGLDGIAEACSRDRFCGGEMLLVDASKSVLTKKRRFLKAMRRLMKVNFSHQYKRRNEERLKVDLELVFVRECRANCVGNQAMDNQTIVREQLSFTHLTPFTSLDNNMFTLSRAGLSRYHLRKPVPPTLGQNCWLSKLDMSVWAVNRVWNYEEKENCARAHSRNEVLKRACILFYAAENLFRRWVYNMQKLTTCGHISCNATQLQAAIVLGTVS